MLVPSQICGAVQWSEVPAKTDKAVLYGQIVDAWQSTIADVGPTGADKGEGGKYLLVPPGYSGPIPDDYIVLRSSTYRIFFGFRSIQLGSATEADAYACSQTLKMYPLSEAGSSPQTKIVNGRPYPIHTLPFYDIRALKDIYDIVSVEPVRPQDKMMMGMLATIGIEPGKPFNPPEKYKAAMEQGIIDAYHYMQNLDTKLFASSLYWPDRRWSFVMVPDAQGGFDFVTDNAIDIDKRAAAWFFFTLYPKVLTDRAGTVYLAPVADSAGAHPSGQDLQAPCSARHPGKAILVADRLRPRDLGVHPKPARPRRSRFIRQRYLEG